MGRFQRKGKRNMSTYNITNRSSGAIPYETGFKPLEKIIDFASLGTDTLTGADIGALVAGDIVQFLNVGKGTQIDVIQVEVVTAAPNGVSATGGAAQTVKILMGDGGSATRYIGSTGASVSATAGTVYWGDASTGGTWGSRVAYFYAADGVLQFTVNEAVSKGIIRIKLMAFNWNQTPSENIVGR